MPYDDIEELPANVRGPLPDHAQEIFKEAFNSAWERYDDPGKRKGSSSREEAAMRIAWAAVKKSFEKDDDGKWVRK